MRLSQIALMLAAAMSVTASPAKPGFLKRACEGFPDQSDGCVQVGGASSCSWCCPGTVSPYPAGVDTQHCHVHDDEPGEDVCEYDDSDPENIVWGLAYHCDDQHGRKKKSKARSN